MIAIADEDDSVDNLQLAGATHVLPLKRQLGEQLASRMSAGRAHAHVLGRFKDLLIAELPVHLTPLAGRTVRDARLQETFGVNVVGMWERGRLRLATPERVLDDQGVAVVVGTAEQMAELDTLSRPLRRQLRPGSRDRRGQGGARGRAGRSSATGCPCTSWRRMRRSSAGWPPSRTRSSSAMPPTTRCWSRRASGRRRSVLLSTRDDATNIYLAVYLRRLDPDVRIVSRITHERNLESIHRAGADLVLSYAGLAVEAITAVLQDRELVLLGQGIEFYTLPVSAALEGKTLEETGVAERTGLNVIAIDDRGGTVVSNPPVSRRVEAGEHLLAVGTGEQRARFVEIFGG